jgi:hypothetical protein
MKTDGFINLLTGQPMTRQERWNHEVERQEKEFAEQNRREQEQRTAVETRRVDAENAMLRNAFEQRIANLESANACLEEQLLDIIRATRMAIDALSDQRMELSREQREELRELKTEVAKLGSTLAELRGGDSFKFARERHDQVVDLPNFLPPRRDLN